MDMCVKAIQGMKIFVEKNFVNHHCIRESRYTHSILFRGCLPKLIVNTYKNLKDYWWKLNRRWIFKWLYDAFFLEKAADAFKQSLESYQSCIFKKKHTFLSVQLNSHPHFYLWVVLRRYIYVNVKKSSVFQIKKELYVVNQMSTRNSFGLSA